MKREYLNFPIISAGGVVIIDGQVLMIKRKTEPEAGKWSIPGGVIHIGEEIKDGLKREIFEETGLDIEVKNLVDVVEKIVRDGRGKIIYHYIILDYVCEYISGNVRASSDAEEIAMVSPSALDEFELVDGAKRIIEMAFDCIKEKRE